MIGKPHLPVLANATTVAVNPEGNARAISDAVARGKGGTVTALTAAKAIASDMAVRFF